MSIRFSNLQEYYQNYIAPNRGPHTLKAKVQHFFENDGLSKILIPIGFILASIASIACAVHGIPPLSIESAWGSMQLAGFVLGIAGLVIAYSHQASLISRLNRVIAAELNG